LGHAYRAVGWNRQKRIYDVLIALGVVAYLAAFTGVTLLAHPDAAFDTALLRALGTCGYALLHVILSIGPLARLSSRFLPLLYNRRHLGVTCFLVGLAHGGFALLQYHALGNVSPLQSLLASDSWFNGFAGFPFQWLGAAALAILFLMAATSHDFWLANLGAPAWKRIHMLVYVAWALLVLHVALGFLQVERGIVPAVLVVAGVAWVLGLHLAAGWRERARDRDRFGRGDPKLGAGGRLVDVCAVDDIPEGRAHVATLAGERAAIFRWNGKIAAVSNVCQHQNGPLGEGRIIDGCITCPWHGYQYRPEDGCSPAPFRERVPTFRVRVSGGRVLVDPHPYPAGHSPGPAPIPGAAAGRDPADGPFYVGYQARAPSDVARAARRSAAAVLAFTLLFGAALAASQRAWQPGVFELGRERTLRGVYAHAPVPSLRVPRPGNDAGDSRWLLVRPGKHGPDPQWAALDGREVELSGTLIHRGEGTMVEVAPTGLRALGEGTSDRPAVALGRATLRGEIVDSKCWLGVMNPGNLRTHRACATLCISGGIPPILAARDELGRSLQLVLVGPDGEALNEAVLPLIARPVEIEGEVERFGDLLVLRAAAGDIRPLDE
jgi:nitrite reductase/ring-hydroxylating ferredoxin subunit/DMSO/TMAO reductase YedYZ heme-binding membrane subunit